MPNDRPVRTDRGSSPIPGESRLALVTLSVLLGIAVAGLIAALVASASVTDLGPTVTVTIVFVVVAGIGFAVALLQRRAYLREVRLGRVVERDPWSGADLLPPG